MSVTPNNVPVLLLTTPNNQSSQQKVNIELNI